MKKIYLTSAALLIITGLVKGQNKGYNLPSVSLGAGILSFDGSINKSQPFTQITAGYHASIEQAISRFMAVSISGLYGTLTDNQMNINSQHLNFQSKIQQGDLNLLFHLDKTVSPYASIGLGYMAFDPYTDLYDANGVRYNYWSDGTIRNLPQNSAGAANAVQLTRDYKYETRLTDSSVNYKRSTLVFPVALGINIDALEHLSLRAGLTYYFTATKWIDNIGKNYDSYAYINLSVIYHIGKKKSDEHFSKIETEDRDSDGVKDLDDICPGTPAGAVVDKGGCPVDTDKDGVPDYKDKEANTPAGSTVNAEGVTMTAEMSAKKKDEFDQLASGKLKSYVENTKMDTVKVSDNSNTGDKKTTAPQNGNNQKTPTASASGKAAVNSNAQTSSTVTGNKPATSVSSAKTSVSNNTANNPAPAQSNLIPADLKMFDKNNDGQISSDEISAAIDGFFEGQANITIAKLNQLIDFFFDQ